MKNNKLIWIICFFLILAILLMICVVGCNSCMKANLPSSSETSDAGFSSDMSTSTIPLVHETTTIESDRMQPVETEPKATEPSLTEETDPSVTETTASHHTHHYTNTVKSPTCTTKGYTQYTCSCGDSYMDDYTPAIGHSWGAWQVTKEATTSTAGEKTRTCSGCGSTETQRIDKLPAEDPTEPVGCQHNWQTVYHPEVGHYGDPYVVCVCGYKCQTQEQWLAHVKSIGGEESVLYHTSWSSGKDYIIDSPAYYEWICSKCGAVTDTQP